MSTVPALSLPSAGDRFETTTIERRDLRPDDVRIEIHYAGICHTDLHYGHDEWGNAFFPMTPGHEIAGVVTEVGPEVTRHQVGDRVGVGCISNSCRECDQCDDGQEQFCRKGMVMTYSTEDYDGTITKGGYSRSTVVGERYAVRIPDGLGLDAAAPLLCAGITMYSPLRHWGVGPDTRIAIIGMGGLGHVGVKLAAAMGAKVTVLSQTTSKEEDGRRFGAAAYHATEDEETFATLAGSFDLILNTVSADLPLDKYLSLLDVDGTLVEVGAPGQPQSFGVFSLLAKRASLAGTSIGGMPETQEMLDFCAEHGVAPEIETIAPTPDAVREAWHRIADSKARYRVVIDVAGLDAD